MASRSRLGPAVRVALVLVAAIAGGTLPINGFAAVAIPLIQQHVRDPVLGHERPQAIRRQLRRQQRGRPHREERVRPRLPVRHGVITGRLCAQPRVDPRELVVL